MMKFELEIIKWIQNNLRNNFFDTFFYLLTQIGDLYFFILILAIIYWLVDKKYAYKFLFSYILVAGVIGFLKVLVGRIRPYKYLLEEGYLIPNKWQETVNRSFPSGHSSSISSVAYGIDNLYGKTNKYVRISLILALIIIPFSRLYLAQHFISDIIVGIIIGLVFSAIGFYLFDLMKDKEHIYPLFIIPFIIIVLIVFMVFNKESSEVFSAAGGYIGFTTGYYLEKVYVKHNVKATLLQKVLKLLIGFSGIAVIYLIFKFIPSDNQILLTLSFMSMGLWAAYLAPLIFKKLFNQNIFTI